MKKTLHLTSWVKWLFLSEIRIDKIEISSFIFVFGKMEFFLVLDTYVSYD